MSDEENNSIDTVFAYFNSKRHVYPLNSRPDVNFQLADWRLRDRLKTVSVAIVLCLNIGIDPPDIQKPDPCAKLEAWVDPFSQPPQKALEAIGQQLQQQYEIWQPRARYRLVPDPSIEEIKKLCCSLRRNAKDERILFHYNGHGVPKPTASGELWVFNKNYTQYIPVSVYDVQTWLGSPCIYVYDCSHAGNILLAFNKYAQQRDAEHLKNLENAILPEDMKKSCMDRIHSHTSSNNEEVGQSNPKCNDQDGNPDDDVVHAYIPFCNSLQLAACGPSESLPLHPDLPADVFTSCLTTPIIMGLRWYISKNPLLNSITTDMLDKIPGRLNDRRTPIGELNWIFTAVTDTIAWNLLPHELFSKLFRQDLMVAALFRNFLLADRIMRFYQCTPISFPPLPPTFQHAMWDAWDRSAELCLFQLPELLKSEAEGRPLDYKNSAFFAEQLSAFEIWLKKASVTRDIPEQLPIVLQVLLSQVHRLRALMLLSKFLDLGPWAVNQALSVGIFPYISKLLQSPAAELKPVLIFIWSKIIAVDISCQNDLLKDNSFTYFVNVLSLSSSHLNFPSLSENRAMCAFILSKFCHNLRTAQQACIKADLVTSLLIHLSDSNPLLRQWSCICVVRLLEGFPEAKVMVIAKTNLYAKILDLAWDRIPEVRASSLYGIGILLSIDGNTHDENFVEEEIIMKLLKVIDDGSPLVRKEFCIVLSHFITNRESKFITVAYELFEEEKRKRYYYDVTRRKNHMYFASTSRIPGRNSLNSLVWKTILCLSVDTQETVAMYASHVVDSILIKIFNSNLMDASTVKSIMKIPDPTISIKSSIGSVLINLAFGETGTPRVPLTSTHQQINSEIMRIWIPSQFYDYSASFFSEPQMKALEIDDPGSISYESRQFRKMKNNVLTEQYEDEMFSAVKKRFGNPIIPFADSEVSNLLFSTFDTHITYSNSSNEIKTFDWILRKTVKSWALHLPQDSKISYMSFINEDDQPLLVLFSNDGVLRIVKDYDTSPSLVTSFRALPYIQSNKLRKTFPNQPMKHLVFGDWSQSTGLFACAGTMHDRISIWDMERELSIDTIMLSGNAALQCLCLEKWASNVVAAGFEDGCVKLMDRRLDRSKCVVAEFNDQSTAIKSILLKSDTMQLCSCSKDGSLFVWDIRQSGVTLQKKVGGIEKTFYQSVDFHLKTELFVSVNEGHEVQVSNFDEFSFGKLQVYNVLSRYRLIPQKKETASSVKFHSHKLLYAVGTGYGGVLVGAK